MRVTMMVFCICVYDVYLLYISIYLSLCFYGGCQYIAKKNVTKIKAPWCSKTFDFFQQ